MDLDAHRAASATINHSLFCKIYLEASKFDMGSLRQSINLGEKYFRLRNYERAYTWFLAAKFYAKTQKCLTKINVFIIFSLLALQKNSEALRLLSKQQPSMIKYESVSLLQIYIKFGFIDRAFEFHKQVHALPYGMCRDSLMVQLFISLIHGFDQKGMKLQAKSAYQFACQILKYSVGFYSSIAYEVFQQVYFLLFYGYRNNLFEFRYILLKLMKMILEYMESQDRQSCKFLKNQLNQGKEYDILLLSFDPTLLQIQ